MSVKIKGWLFGVSSIRKATWILAATLFLSNVLGLVRERYLAQKIPVVLLDTYDAAFRWPDLIFNTLILGAISAAFIPVFVDKWSRGKKQQSFDLANNMIGLALVSLCLAAVLFWLLMPFLVKLTIPGLSADKVNLTIGNARILLISPIVFGLSYIVAGVLNSTKRFLVPALSPLFYNLSIIVATLLFAPRFGIRAIVWGAVAGSILHLLIQLPGLKKIGFSFKPIFNFQSKELAKIGRLMAPRAISLGAAQFVPIGFTAFASNISPGAIALFFRADNIQTAPTVIFASAIAQALFPTLSESFNRKDEARFASYLAKAVRAVVFFLLPMALWLVILRAQIIRLILGTGLFGWRETVIAADILGYFGVGLVFSGLVAVLARASYARRDTLTPAIISLVSVGLTLVLGKVLSSQLGAPGLALAFSFGMIFSAVALFSHLSKSVNLDHDWLVIAIGKIVAATIIMTFATQATKTLVGIWLHPLDRFVHVLAQLGLALAAGIVTYFLVLKLLGFEGLELPKLKLFSRQLGQGNGQDKPGN